MRKYILVIIISLILAIPFWFLSSGNEYYLLKDETGYNIKTPKDNLLMFTSSELENTMLFKWTYDSDTMKEVLKEKYWKKIDNQIEKILQNIIKYNKMEDKYIKIINEVKEIALSNKNNYYAYFQKDRNFDIILLLNIEDNVIYKIRASK